MQTRYVSRIMIAPPSDLPAALADAVAQYESSGNIGGLMERLHRLRDDATPDALVAAAEAWLHMPEVAGPLYERVVEAQPNNARALVILANAYWLSGRGPDVVAPLAARAMSVDPENRGAWHMWALTEENQRDRTIRWLQVTQRFPTDPVAKAALADNAASLAAAEHDKEALAMAITAYEDLWALSPNEQQRAALETALTTLRNYAF
jgi:tetratricopeptide (TPR) repeat protein